MRKWFILIIMLSVSVVCFSISNAYDKVKPEKEIPTVWQCHTYVRIKTVGIAEGLYVDLMTGEYRSKKTLFQLEGSGFVYKPGFILTVAHIIKPDLVAVIDSSVSAIVSKPIHIYERRISVYDYRDVPHIAYVYHIDYELDLALLRYDNYDILKPIPYGSINGDCRDLEAGDIVCAVLHKRDESGTPISEVELRYGVIIDTEPISAIPGANTAWWSPYDMTLDMAIRPGDSGSPVFAFTDGKPILIGICRAVEEDPLTCLFYSYAVVIPRIDRYVEAWENNRK